MNSQAPNLSPADLDQQRESIRQGLIRVKTAAGIMLCAVGMLAMCALVAGWKAAKNAQAAQKASLAIEAHRAETEFELAKSRLAEARALRLSGQIGRRSGALAAITQAAKINPTVSMRDEAVASFGLDDFGDDEFFLPDPNKKAGGLLCLSNWTVFAYGMEDGSVRFVSKEKAAPLFSLPGSGVPVEALTIDSQERYLAVCDSKRAAVWDLADRTLLFSKPPVGYFNDLPHLSLNRDGAIMACALDAGGVTICEVPSGRDLGTLPFTNRVGRLAFHPEKNWLAVVDRSEVQIWDLAARTKIQTFRTKDGWDINTTLWSPDGRTVAFASEDSRIYLCDLESRRQRILEGHDRECVHLAFNKSGEKLLSNSWGANSRLWDVVTGETLISTFQGYARRFSPDDKHILFIRPRQGFGAWPFTRAEGHRALRLPPGASPAIRSADLSSDGQLLAILNFDGLWLWDMATGRYSDFGKASDGKSLFFTNGGRSILTSSGEGIFIWPIVGNKLGPRRNVPLPEGSRPDQSSLSRNGTKLIIACGWSYAAILDLTENRPPVFLTNSPGLANMALSPDGKLAATGTWKGIGTRVWDAESGQCLREIGGRDAGVAFSPDGKWLVVGSSVEYRFWDIEKLAPARSIARDPSGETTGQMGFTPDGRIFVFAKSLREIQLANAETLEKLVSIPLSGSAGLGFLRLDGKGENLILESRGKIDLWNIPKMRQELATLDLDWGAPLARRASAGQPSIAARSHFLMFKIIIALAVSGILLTVFFGVVVLRRFQHLIHHYAQIEGVVLERNRQLEFAQSELFQGQKMRALGTLAAGIAHDFNNLLSVIRMANKLTSQEVGQNPEVQENVELIEKAVGQGKEVVDSMLGYGREPLTPAGPYSLAELLKSTINLLGKQFLSGIDLRMEIEANLPLVASSKARLEQILLNLIVNASEAMSGKGQLVLGLRLSSEVGPNCVLTPKGSKSYIELTVSDSGSGIDPAILDRIFEPFFSTKIAGNQRGTGLGLSMVYTLAEMDGLGIAIHSAPQKGASFRLIIPAKESTIARHLPMADLIANS